MQNIRCYRRFLPSLQQVLRRVVQCLLAFLLIEVLAFSAGSTAVALAQEVGDVATDAAPDTAQQERWILDEPDRVSELSPGRRALRTVQRYGDKSTAQRFRLWRTDDAWDARDPHACIEVRVAEKTLSHDRATAPTLNLGKDQAFEVEVRARPDCGWLEDKRVRSLPLAFESGGVTGHFSIPYILRNESRLPDALRVDVTAGSTAEVWLEVSKQSEDALAYRWTLENSRSAPPLPACLDVRWTSAPSENAQHENQEHHVELGGTHGWSHQGIQVHADRGCDAGKYQIPVRIAGASSASADIPEELRVLHVHVLPTSRRPLWLVLVGSGLMMAVVWVQGRRRRRSA